MSYVSTGEAVPALIISIAPELSPVISASTFPPIIPPVISPGSSFSLVFIVEGVLHSERLPLEVGVIHFFLRFYGILQLHKNYEGEGV